MRAGSAQSHCRAHGALAPVELRAGGTPPLRRLGGSTTRAGTAHRALRRKFTFTEAAPRRIPDLRVVAWTCDSAWQRARAGGSDLEGQAAARESRCTAGSRPARTPRPRAAGTDRG